ncbi:ABC transporter permease [Halotalea alkalilenta]|uniref:ABC transporter permease n=1 Tax=Halotalea alkalilenta TaxID=376489 RepID=UPI000481855D|nr:ABC transporter permease [Halotalea alkalilenta]
MDFTTTLANMDWQQVMLLTWQHVYLVGIAVGLAILIGVPLGVLIVRLRWLAAPLLTVATVVITIPSIALFGIMLPILRNTYIALDGVDPGIREAGRGIGMTFWQRLWMVDLPLAVPVILGGVRTAVVMNIGVMTIAAVIGAGGLGLLILNGIGQSNVPLLVIGAIIVSLLAIVVDTLLNLLQRLLTSKGIEQ